MTIRISGLQLAEKLDRWNYGTPTTHPLLEVIAKSVELEARDSRSRVQSKQPTTRENPLKSV
jgi:hypothetical protein